jgi:hypothetical protein
MSDSKQVDNLTQFPELKYCVTFFQVSLPNNEALSPRFKAYEQALESLGSIVDMSARITKQTVYFSDPNEAGRHELLANIVSPVEGGKA